MKNSNTEFTTTNGHIAVLKPYITGREALTLSEIVAETEEKKNRLATEAALKLVVVSVDGVVENVVDLVLDLPSLDFTEVTTEVTEIVTGKKAAPATGTI